MAFSLSFSGVVFAQQDKDVRADEAGRAERQAAPPRAPARNREAPPQPANEPARNADPRGSVDTVRARLDGHPFLRTLCGMGAARMCGGGNFMCAPQP